MLRTRDYGVCVSCVAMKRVLLVCGIVVSFVSGYRYAAALYEADIATLKEDYARRAVELQEEYRAKERFAKDSMVAAWEQRDAAYARLRERGAELERVRGEADAAKRRLSSASAATCKSEREQLARCAGLLERGYGLLERGVELSSRTAIDKDAIVKIVQ